MPVSRVDATDLDVPSAAAAPPPAQAAGASSSSAPPVAAASTGIQELPPDLADQLYTKIERRLRMELLLDQERKGTLSNALWSPR